MAQGHGKRTRRAHKKHLYLVLDDWEKGYSIRQIDPDAMLSDFDSYDFDSDLAPQYLPEPAATRFVAPALDTRFFAMGSNIVAVSSGGGTEEESPIPTLVYDTAAAALAVAPPAGAPRWTHPPLAGGDALYALTTLGAGLPPALETFSWAPCTGDADEPWPGRKHEWSWKSVDASPPPPPSFAQGQQAVVAYAAHPDGRTVFVSTRGGGAEHTYSFHAERREWTLHGAWALPFRGQGHFDYELDAWVGLDKEPGYVRACQVASRTRCTTAPPESDRLQEKLFFAGDEGDSEPTLTYMGDSKFCLVDSVAPDEDEEGLACECDREVYVLTFGLKFDRKGKLKTTSQRKSSSYAARKYMPGFSPVAFWM